MNHTPGPWTVSISDNARIEDRIAAADGTPVFVGRCANFDNAQLLAAAPELLVALQWALRQIEDDLDPDHQAAMQAARAAINKATGE